MASDLTVGGAGYCGLTTLGECQRLALEHLKSRSEVGVKLALNCLEQVVTSAYFTLKANNA